MNSSQKRIVTRFAVMASLLLLAFTILFSYLTKHIITDKHFEVLGVMSLTYLIMIFILWLREKTLFEDYLMHKRIASGQIAYMLCPSCKSIQIQGKRRCNICGEKWISCKACNIPFEPKSQVLIAPCCGQGFHIEHFEVALRELSHCPYCKSDLALKTTNW